MLVKQHAFLLVVHHVVTKSQFVQGVLVFHVLFQAQLQVGDGGFIVAHVLVNVGYVQQNFVGFFGQVERFFVVFQCLAITLHALVQVAADDINIRVRCFEHSRFFERGKCIADTVGDHQKLGLFNQENCCKRMLVAGILCHL